MEIYFLKSVACLAIFLVFYKLLLEKENMHLFKRFYLLTAMLAAVAIPYITFTTYVEPSPEVFQPLQIPSSESTVEVSGSISEYLETGLWIVYFLGVLFFSIKFCRSFLLIVQRIRQNPKVREDNFIHVLLNEKLNPHTFFSYIFLNKIKYEKQEIPEEVIIHEQAHALQKHSLDVLLVELAQIIFWFNPLLFLLKDAIKLNHEFLADESVLKKGTNPTGYKKTLLSYSSGGLESGLVNPIDYSSIKKRFTVMKSKTSQTAVWTRSLLVLPLLAVLVYGFSTKEVVEKPINDQLSTFSESEIKIKLADKGRILLENEEYTLEGINRMISLGDYSSYKIEVEENVAEEAVREIIVLMTNYRLAGSVVSCTKSTSQEKATPEMIAEYNKLVKHYNSLPKGTFQVKQEDANRIMYILSLMTPEQKEKAEKILFNVPPPPPPAPAPEPMKGEGENMPVPPPPPVNEKTPPAPPVPEEEALPAPPPPPLAEDLPQAPPPPPPVSFEELVKEGAVFYYNNKVIEPEEARKLVEVEKKVNVHITSTDDEKPVVRLSDKKEKK